MCNKANLIGKLDYEIMDTENDCTVSGDFKKGLLYGLGLAKRFINETKQLDMYKKFLEWAKKELEECEIEYRKHFDAKEFELLYIYAGRIRQLKEIIEEHWKVGVIL